MGGFQGGYARLQLGYYPFGVVSVSHDRVRHVAMVDDSFRWPGRSRITMPLNQDGPALMSWGNPVYTE